MQLHPKEKEIRKLLEKEYNYFSNTKEQFLVHLHEEVSYNYLRQNILNILDGKSVDTRLDHILFKDTDDYAVTP